MVKNNTYNSLVKRALLTILVCQVSVFAHANEGGANSGGGETTPATEGSAYEAVAFAKTFAPYVMRNLPELFAERQSNEPSQKAAQKAIHPRAKFDTVARSLKLVIPERGDWVPSGKDPSLPIFDSAVSKKTSESKDTRYACVAFEDGKWQRMEGSHDLQTNTICLSPDLIDLKKFSKGDILKKVIGLYFHEVGHLLRLTHDEAVHFQLIIEVRDIPQSAYEMQRRIAKLMLDKLDLESALQNLGKLIQSHSDSFVFSTVSSLLMQINSIIENVDFNVNVGIKIVDMESQLLFALNRTNSLLVASLEPQVRADLSYDEIFSGRPTANGQQVFSIIMEGVKEIDFSTKGFLAGADKLTYNYIPAVSVNKEGYWAAMQKEYKLLVAEIKKAFASADQAAADFKVKVKSNESGIEQEFGGFSLDDY